MVDFELKVPMFTQLVSSHDIGRYLLMLNILIYLRNDVIKYDDRPTIDHKIEAATLHRSIMITYRLLVLPQKKY